MPKPRKWIFDARKHPPGDLLVLSATLREIHFWYNQDPCNPEFITDIRSDFPDIWQNNPYLTPLDTSDPNVEVIEFDYPLLTLSNLMPVHFLEAYMDHLNRKYNLRLSATQFRGEVYLTPDEIAKPSQVTEAMGTEVPYWVIVSGGKHDFTVKWWDHERLQEVVDHFAGRILFVQVGQHGFYHPPLSGVYDLRGKTSIRELMRLVYHADGVISPITFLMHLTAAVPRKNGHARGCVTIGGGREPIHFYSYPTHRVLHTVGCLPCCQDGGCWRSRVMPLDDGSPNDNPDQLCMDVVGERLPRCMDLITSSQVAESIAGYYEGGCLEYVNPLGWGDISRKLEIPLRNLAFQSATAQIGDPCSATLTPMLHGSHSGEDASD